MSDHNGFGQWPPPTPDEWAHMEQLLTSLEANAAWLNERWGARTLPFEHELTDGLSRAVRGLREAIKAIPAARERVDAPPADPAECLPHQGVMSLKRNSPICAECRASYRYDPEAFKAWIRERSKGQCQRCKAVKTWPELREADRPPELGGALTSTGYVCRAGCETWTPEHGQLADGTPTVTTHYLSDQDRRRMREDRD